MEFVTAQISAAVTNETTDNRTSAHHRILVALDSSDHANAAMCDALALAKLSEQSVITGTHAYAAKLHDARFRQMEGGLPEQFREEQELERQRDVHDDLITRGLSIITDCYLDQAERSCQQADIPFARCSLEGKNYRVLVEEANSGAYDLLVMGSLGLGALEGSRLGTVCQRVARRSCIDTLVVKQPARSITEGPIVVAVDGSAKSYGGLLTALSLAQLWKLEVKVVSVFDPYYHYVAFNRIAGVLSEEAGKVFKFKEQEKLHEEIIDSGLAKIYQGHLDVAETIAKDMGVAIEAVLLDGKPHDAIEKYVRKLNPSLLIMGKLGIHADADLDIGGNAENLLHSVDCAVLLSQREYTPKLDVVADVTTSWTRQAEQAMEIVPSFARNMARMAILRYAQQEGHTVITESIVKQATVKLCPMATEAMGEIVAAKDAGELDAARVASQEKGFAKMPWSTEAAALLSAVLDDAVRNNLKHRSEKKARAEHAETVQKCHIEAFLGTGSQPGTAALHWQATALARLMRVPEGFMRESCRSSIEAYARRHGLADVDIDTAEAGLAEARQKMSQMMPQVNQPESAATSGKAGGCPFSGHNDEVTGSASQDAIWTDAAEERLLAVPEGMSREMTRKAVSSIARQKGMDVVDAKCLEDVLATFSAGSAHNAETMAWSDEARQGIGRAPDMVRGMLTSEIEGWAKRQGLSAVDVAAVAAVKREWADRGVFHLDPEDPRSDS